MFATARRSALFALTATLIALPATARADSTTTTTPAPAQTDSAATASQALGPTAASAAVAVKARHGATESTAALAQSRRGLGQARALMIVGLGTFIAGAVIGGDAGTIIMIGGAVMGLYGLYQYLQ